MDVMNTLLVEIVRSLKELQLGFAGELTMSDAMEGLMDALFMDKARYLIVDLIVYSRWTYMRYGCVQKENIIYFAVGHHILFRDRTCTKS